jgi:hypothetical protein
MPRQPAIAPTVVTEPESGGGTQRRSTHPAFATVRVSRISGQKNLFDSNIPHDGYVEMTFASAEKIEGDYSTYIHGRNMPMFRVAMSESQFVGMVSRMNVGSGVPCTVIARGSGPLEELPEIGVFEDSAAKLHRKAQEIYKGRVERVDNDVQKLKEILSRLPKGAQKEAASLLDYITQTTHRNLQFGMETMTEQAEDLVAEAKVEINATVTGIVNRLGLNSIGELRKLANLADEIRNQSLLGNDND